MSRFNTGNPLGSGDPRDLDDNAKNMDLAMNSTEHAWVDRFKRSRLTYAGMQNQFNLSQESRERRFNDFIASSGYQFAGDYGPGIEITEYNQLIRDSNGEFWRLSGQVELPYTTTGAGIPEDDALVPAGDAVLRQDLANPDKGAAMVARGSVSVTNIDEIKALPADKKLSVELSGSRAGVFYYYAGDLSEMVAIDTLEGIYVAPDSDPTGASGAWVRQFGQSLLAFPVVDATWFGLGEVGIDSATAINAAIAVAKNALEYGANVSLPSGNFLIHEPIILPRTGATPRSVVRLSGTGMRSTRLQGTNAFPAGRSVIEWEEVPDRTWCQKITGMNIICPPVDGTGGIHYKRIGTGSSMVAYLSERLQLDLDDVLIDVTNRFNPFAISLEANQYGCAWGHVEVDASPGTEVNYDTVGLLLDASEPEIHISADGPGMGFSMINSFIGTPRRGGYLTLIKGRLNRTEIGFMTLGNGSFKEPSLDLYYSFGYRIGQVSSEGKGGRPHYRFTGCVGGRIGTLGLGTPVNVSGLGPGNGVEFIDSQYCTIEEIQRSVGSQSYAVLGAKAVLFDTDTLGCRVERMLMSGATGNTYMDDIQDDGVLNFVGGYRPGIANLMDFRVGFKGDTVTVGPWIMPAVTAGMKTQMRRGATEETFGYDSYIPPRPGYVVGFSVALSEVISEGTVQVEALSDGSPVPLARVTLNPGDQYKSVVINAGQSPVKADKRFWLRVVGSAELTGSYYVIADALIES